MYFFLTVAVVFCLLIGSEAWYRRHTAHGEFSRKFIHITVGSFVAFWPFFLSWNSVLVLSLGFLVVVGISKWLNLFQAIHSVQRPTWGEVYFAIAVGSLALITDNKWIYAAALLQMSLADGLAAVIGTRFGNSSRYLIFGHTKSLIGTLTFFVVSLVILLALGPQLPQHFSAGELAGLALLATVIENFAVSGLDNLFIPLIIGLVLSNI